MFKFWRSKRKNKRLTRRDKRLLCEQLEPRRVLSGSYLDPEFGDQGCLRLGGFEDAIHGMKPPDADVHVLADGKLFVMTQGRMGRYLSDGTPDTTFGGDGLVDTKIVGPPYVRTI